MERYDKFERIKALIQLGYAVSVDFRLHGDKKTIKARLSRDCDVEELLFSGKEVQRVIELLKLKVGNC